MTEPTLRDALIARLTAEFGEGKSIGHNRRWVLTTTPGHAPLSLALNSYKTPDEFRLWMFDPRRTLDRGAVQSFLLTDHKQIEGVIANIRAMLPNDQQI